LEGIKEGLDIGLREHRSGEKFMEKENYEKGVDIEGKLRVQSVWDRQLLRFLCVVAIVYLDLGL
jgi:hypothetical protein